jgi:hypothetical protein
MSQIKNFEDLKLERKRLEILTASKTQELRTEIALLKEQFKPFSMLARWLGGVQRVSNHPIVAGANVGIDLLVRDKLLSKSNWFIRSVVPFALKNIVSLFDRIKKPATDNRN